MPVIFEEDTRLQKVHAKLADIPLRELILTCCKNDSAERPTMTECIEKLHELKRNEPLDSTKFVYGFAKVIEVV